MNFNRSILPAKGELLAENTKVILKAVSDADYDDYITVSYECSIMKSYYKDEDFKRDFGNRF